MHKLMLVISRVSKSAGFTYIHTFSAETALFNVVLFLFKNTVPTEQNSSVRGKKMDSS